MVESSAGVEESVGVAWIAGVEESVGVGVRKERIPFIEEGSVASVTMLCVVGKVSRDCVQGEESKPEELEIPCD